MSADRRRAELSQHFLRRGATAARLVHGTSISSADLVVEIGAGRGALTLPLSQRAGRLLAIEIDSVLAGQLASRFHQRSSDTRARRVEVINADFLAMPLPAMPYKAFGNVPFSVTTEIVRKLTHAANPPSDAWLVVQREAAHRFCGAPYVRESLASLRLKPWWHVEISDRLRRVDFDPPPSVESVLLWLYRRDRPLLHDAEARIYLRLVEQSFADSRSVDHAARRWLSKIEIRRLGRDLRFDPNANPGALGFEQWLGIARYIARTHRASG